VHLRELILGRTRALGQAFVLVLVLGAIVPLLHSSFWMYTLGTVATFSIAVIGLNVITGMAGQVSFATTAFMDIGAYCYAVFTTKYHVDPWLSLVIGLIAAGVIGFIVGIPLLRLKGHYLALGTFALALAFEGIATGANVVTGGPIGLSAIPALTVGDLSFASTVPFYFLAWSLAAVCVLMVIRLRNSRIGRAWLALSTREDVALSLGINVSLYKVLAFVISAVLAALSGILYVELTTFVSPDVYGTDFLIQIFAMLFIGGLATYIGPMVGAAVVVILPTVFSVSQSVSALIFELLLLLIIVVFPHGFGEWTENYETLRSFVARLRRQGRATGLQVSRYEKVK